MGALENAMQSLGYSGEDRRAPRRHLTDWGIRFRPPATVSAAEITEARELNWFAGVRDQFEHVAHLPVGWDASDAGPVRRDILDYALAILEVIMRSDSPPPHVTPMSHEGVMLEWHSESVDLEIEIKEPGSAYVTYANRRTGEEKDLRLIADFRQLAVYLARSTSKQ